MTNPDPDPVQLAEELISMAFLASRRIYDSGGGEWRVVSAIMIGMIWKRAVDDSVTGDAAGRAQRITDRVVRAYRRMVSLGAQISQMVPEEHRVANLTDEHIAVTADGIVNALNDYAGVFGIVLPDDLKR